MFVPNDDNLLVSCAEDGVLACTDRRTAKVSVLHGTLAASCSLPAGNTQAAGCAGRRQGCALDTYGSCVCKHLQLDSLTCPPCALVHACRRPGSCGCTHPCTLSACAGMGPWSLWAQAAAVCWCTTHAPWTAHWLHRSSATSCPSQHSAGSTCQPASHTSATAWALQRQQQQQIHRQTQQPAGLGAQRRSARVRLGLVRAAPLVQQQQAGPGALLQAQQQQARAAVLAGHRHSSRTRPHWLCLVGTATPHARM